LAEVVELLERLCRVDTHNPGGDERVLADVLAGELAARGADAVTVVDVSVEQGGYAPSPGGAGRASPRAYVWARWGEPRLLVNAHIDTVPPNAGWTGDPYVPRVADGRVTALGAADTKGAIAAILTALAAERPRDTGVLFSGDEELTGTCMRAFLASGRAQGVTRAIVCEPTGCRVGVRHRGVMAIEVRRRGKGGHSSKADHMPAPIAELARLAVAYDMWGRARRNDGPVGFEGMCMNVAGLAGGVAFNVVPEEATLTISLRPPPGADAAAIRADLVGLARHIVPEAEVRVPLDNPPFATRDLAALRPFVGDAPAIDLAFWTEAAVLAAAGTGIDAVVYGPGDIGVAHAADEFVPIADLERATATFAAAFRATGDGSR
jgi:acetylornithine deacetylase